MSEIKNDNDKKFYWLKLKKDFFKRHDIEIIENMDNGKDYVLFYLKLLVESIDHFGNLRFSDTIPYNEKMLASVTHTNIDIVRSAMQIFKELDMVEMLDDQTIYMCEVQKMIGCESIWAEKKREYRERQKQISGQCPNDVLPLSDKRLDIDKDKDKEEVSKKENIKKEYNQSARACASYDEIFEDFGVGRLEKESLITFIKHLQLNGIKILNDRLEKIIIKLDMRYGTDEQAKVREIEDSIAKAYKWLPCEQLEA